MMRVKNHQMPPMIRVESALGISSEPGGGGGTREGNLFYIHHIPYPRVSVLIGEGFGFTAKL